MKIVYYFYILSVPLKADGLLLRSETGNLKTQYGHWKCIYPPQTHLLPGNQWKSINVNINLR